jgi:hypothetical protein
VESIDKGDANVHQSILFQLGKWLFSIYFKIPV